MLNKMSKILIISFLISLVNVNKSFGVLTNIYNIDQFLEKNEKFHSFVLGFGSAFIGNKLYQFKGKDRSTLAGAGVTFLAATYVNMFRRSGGEDMRFWIWLMGSGLGHALAQK